MVERLGVADAEAVYALRREALAAEPLAFGSSLEDDRLSVEYLEQILDLPDVHAILGAYADGLVGLVGVMRGTKAKVRHRADLFGMYVRPEARGQGVGAGLLQAAIGAVRAWGVSQLHLSVTSAAPGARRLYERAGFTCWGTTRDALRWQGESVDEHHFVLEV